MATKEVVLQGGADPANLSTVNDKEGNSLALTNGTDYTVQVKAGTLELSQQATAPGRSAGTITAEPTSDPASFLTVTPTSSEAVYVWTFGDSCTISVTEA